MRTLAIALLAALLAFNLASVSHAEEIAPDENLLVLACDLVRARVEVEGYGLRTCRRAKPEEIAGNRATVYINVFITGYGRASLVLRFQRSLWTSQSIAEQ